MFKQISFAAVVAASTYTTLTRSKNPVLADSFTPSISPIAGERLTARDLNQSPGVLAWGSNKNRILSSSNDIPVVRFPTRLEYFNGRLLRDLALSGETAVAVLENGDVLQWGALNSSANVRKPRLHLKGKNIVKVRVSNDKAVYALANSGSIYSWSADSVNSDDSTSLLFQHWYSYFSFFWGGFDSHRSSNAIVLQTPSLSLREYIQDIEVGKDHILALTSKGRVFSGSTGFQKPKESKGQYGIASMSQFDEAPEPGKLHEIKLLKNVPISQIAVGDYHSLVLTKDGKLLGFGDNIYGQLGIPYSYRTANIAVPTELPISNALLADIQRKVTGIAAGGAISYFTISAGIKSEDVYSMGNGLSGQLGTGSFSHSQRSPLKIKHFSGLSEYSESLNKSVPINISSWSVGPSHTVVTLDNSQACQDVLIWGSNESSQLGNGKRNIAGYPRSIPLYETDQNKVATVSPVGLQLAKGVTMEFKNENGKSRKAKVDQVICCGNSMTAIYYRPAK